MACGLLIVRWFVLVVMLSGLMGCSMLAPAASQQSPVASVPGRVSLAGNWDFLPSGEAELPAPDADWQAIRVPGNWYPQGYGHAGYAWYRTTFQAPSSAAVSTLHFTGVDYFADVWLNGVKLGSHEGYFQAFWFDISSQLRAGSNELLVQVNSPLEKPEDFNLRKRLIKGVLAHHDTRPGGAWSERGQEGNTGGIWGQVYLQQSKTIQLQADTVQVQPVEGLEKWQVSFRLDTLGQWPQGSELRWSLEPVAGTPDVIRSGVLVSGHVAGDHLGVQTYHIPLSALQLWYPRGLGAASRYTLRVSVQQGDTVLDSIERPLAFRKLQKTPQGIWFLNGQRFLVRGTNYIASQWLGEMTPQRYQQDIDLMLGAHVNTVRVHAHITSQDFYRLCDEAGLMVWQDFPLQWGYQDTDILHAQALTQAEDMVRQLGHHASLIQWTLHNEPPWDAAWMKWKYKDEYNPDQNRVLDEKLYARVVSLDKTRPTVMLSSTQEHPWFGWYSGSWLDYAKPTQQNTISEFGAQALPDKATLAGILGGEPVVPDKREDWKNWEYHNFQPKQALELAKIARGANLDEFIENTRQYQARLIQLAAESYRRQAYQPVGALFHFMLVESWPSMNWGVLDYQRKPKPGYTALQQAYQPVLPSLAWSKVAYAAGEPIDIGVWALNDSFTAYPQVRYQLDVYQDDQWLDSQHWQLDVPADLHRQLAVYKVPAKEPGRYRIDARMLDQQGQVLGSNQYRFDIKK